MGEIAIRAGRPEDAEAVARLCAELSEAEGASPPAFTAGMFRQHGFGPEAAFAAVVAEADGKPVGYALHHGGFDTQMGALGRRVLDLYVAPGFREQGVGRKLLGAVARATRAQGGSWVALQVKPDNHAAQSFYGALGGVADIDPTIEFKGEAFDTLATPPA